MKIIKKIQLKIVIYTAVKNCSVLHGRVFVMECIIRVCLAYLLSFEYFYCSYDGLDLKLFVLVGWGWSFFSSLA